MNAITDRSRSLNFLAAAFLLVTAMLVGGTSRPLNDLLILLSALPLLYLTLSARSTSSLDWTVKLALGLVALAALQLFPLPPSVWTALPGRDLAAASLQASGNGLGWRPIALDPGAAITALAVLIAPITMLAAVTRMEPRMVRRLLAVTAAFAICSAMLGVFQRLTGGLSPYVTEHIGAAIGLFTNRNHHADLLIIGILLLPALTPRGQWRRYRLPLTAAVILLLFAVVATLSRAGIALSVPAALAALWAIWRPNRRLATLLTLFATLGCSVILFLPAFSDIFARFGILADDQRLTMARDSIAAARAMWPMGSGYGSFVPVYMAYENLDMMEARYVVAAHNDYLQLVLEGGLAGVITIASAISALGIILWQIARNNAQKLAWCAWAAAAVLMVHSAFDFPLRTGALSVIFALCIGAAQILPNELRKHVQNAKPL